MGTARFTIEVRPPLRLDLTVWALRRRPHNRVDAGRGTSCARTRAAGVSPLLVAVRQEPDGSSRSWASTSDLPAAGLACSRAVSGSSVARRSAAGARFGTRGVP